ncbi:MAG: glycosyltransferase family 2 protein [Clostridia bacterium]|jgi:glycosyltransferase involved in cell wall biosynthesis|nr:glycosyltransferase family 2 protein [Clostridia bacterium]
MMRVITVFTPTFNREKYLKSAYESLLKQQDQDFEWIIVDDGSEDSTSETVKNFIAQDKMSIKYIYTHNGGKHRAINIGVKLAKGEWFYLLDSDDWLTEDAVYQLHMNAINLQDRQLIQEFFALVGLRKYPDGKIIGITFEGEVIEMGYLEAREKHGIDGDKAWAVRTDLLKKYPFPEFEGEKFLTEDTWYNYLSNLGYKCRFFNYPIYVGEYLSDGLSQRYNELMAQNYQGSLKYFNDYFRYMIDKPKYVMAKFNYYLYISRLAGKSYKEILGNLDNSVYARYQDEINKYL